MITCTPSENGYNISGLSPADLEIIDEALCLAFGLNRGQDHRGYRTAILQIHQPVSEEIDKLLSENEPTLF